MSNIIKGRRILSHGGGAGGLLPADDSRILTLENNEYKIAYFVEVNSTSGTISIPTGATIMLDQFPGGVDALVSTLSSGVPTGINPQTAGGTTVDVTSFDALGNSTLSGTPSTYPVALIYILRIKAIDYSNIVLNNILESELIAYTFSDGLTNTGGNVTNDLITGIVGNQTIIGGTVAGNNLTIIASSDAAKGDIILDLNAIRTLGFDGVNAFGSPGEGFAFYGPNSEWGGSAMFQGDNSFFFGNKESGENTWFLWSFDGTFSFLKGYYLITNGGQVQHQVPQDYATSGKNLTIINQVDNVLSGTVVPTSAGFGQQTRVTLSAGTSTGLTASNVNTYWSDPAFATRTASWAIELVNNGNGTLSEIFKINPQTGAILQTVNTTTAAVDTILTIGNNSSGVPTTGNGSGVLFNLKTAGVGAAIDQAAGKLSSYWTTTNHATRQSAFAIATSQNGGTPLNRFIIEPLGTASTSYVFDAANGGTPELQFKYAGDKRFVFSGGFEIYFQSLYSQHFFSWYPGTGGTQLMNIKTTGVSIKNTTASAWLHIGAGTATAGQAPIKLTSGTNLTTAEAGAIEFTTDNLYFTGTTGTTRKTVSDYSYRAITALRTLDGSDELVDCTANTFAVTLPTAVGYTKQYTVVNSGTGIITINTTSSQTISGVASGVLTLGQWESIIVRSNGANWIKIN